MPNIGREVRMDAEDQIPGYACRRREEREAVALAGSALALGCSRSIIISDLSPSGAQIDARDLPPPGEDVLMVAGSQDAFARVMWRTDEKCGIRFASCAWLQRCFVAQRRPSRRCRPSCAT